MSTTNFIYPVLRILGWPKPGPPPGPGNWLLRCGFWDDDGVWDDDAIWDDDATC